MYHLMEYFQKIHWSQKDAMNYKTSQKIAKTVIKARKIVTNLAIYWI